MALRTFHLVESETPHPIVAASLDAALFERCRIECPAPVHFMPMPRWRGECPSIEDTMDGELRLADHLLDEHKDPAGMRDGLVYVYLHELAHRLTPGHGHDPGFAAVNILLLVRAGNDRNGRPYLNKFDLYDLQGFDLVEFCSPGEALDWALSQARELAETDLSAEACALEILSRFEAWKEWKGRTPDREEAAAAAKRKNAAALHALHNSIADLSRSRWKWLASGVVMGTLIHFIPMFF